MGWDEGTLVTVLVFKVWSATKLAIESINGRSGRIGVSSNEDHVPQIRRPMQLGVAGVSRIGADIEAGASDGSTCSW